MSSWLRQEPAGGIPEIFSRFVKVERQKVYNPHTQSEAIVLASDAPTSFGLLVEWVWCEELVH